MVVLSGSRERPTAAGVRWVHVFTFQNGRIVAFEDPADVTELVLECMRLPAIGHRSGLLARNARSGGFAIEEEGTKAAPMHWLARKRL